jgi:Omp85 superfamily domain
MKRVGIALLASALAVAAAGSAAETDTAAPSPDSVAARAISDSYTSFLDSLRTRSAATLDREGVESTWPAADSLTELLTTHGPAYVDSLPSFERAAFDFDFGPQLLAYNRVEGLRLGAEAEVTRGGWSVAGAAAYAISSEHWRHRERLGYDTGRFGAFTVEHADLVERYGAGPVPANSIHALVAGADDQDYLERRRTGVEWRLDLGSREVEVDYTVARERSVVAETDWNIFSRDRGPRPNPPIDEGDAHRLRMAGGWSGDLHRLGGTRFRLDAEAEVGGYGLGGDFDYDRYRLALDSHWPALWRDNIDLTMEVGGARNRPPLQSLFYLGGPVVLRAYPVNEFRGDRYAFGRFEYLVGTDPLARMGIRAAQIQLIPFFELGAAWTDENGTGVFSAPESSDWRSDAGFGLQRRIAFDAILRFDAAWRLDRDTDRLTTRFGLRTPLFGIDD